MNRTLLLILAFMFTGCNFEWPDPADGDYACLNDADCVEPFVCDFSQGICIDESSCPEGQHRVGDTCFPNAGVETCWNGTSSVNCLDEVPDNSTVNCALNTESGFYNCSYNCLDGFVVDIDTLFCVCPSGQHENADVCYENSDVQHCWDGVQSQDCTGLDIPVGSSPVCMGLGNDLYTCSFDCNGGFVLYDNGCAVVPEDMVYVPEGSFWMGCDENEPTSSTECLNREMPYHEVYLSAYFIDKYEVTAAEYKECVLGGACNYSAQSTNSTYDMDGLGEHPVNKIKHAEAVTYCHWRNKRLPTEAEWEKAARGVDGDKYPWGNDDKTCDLAVINGCPGETKPVGSLPDGASPIGDMDMSGNLMEWVQDWASETYYQFPPSDGWFDPQGPESNENDRKITKGGAFMKPESGNDYSHRASWRGIKDASGHNRLIGFRCVQEPTL